LDRCFSLANPWKCENFFLRPRSGRGPIPPGEEQRPSGNISRAFPP
jgi:hypothetical protein